MNPATLRDGRLQTLLWMMALSVAVGAVLASRPAHAFGGGFGGAVDAATTAVVAGYGAQAITSSAEDDNDD
jgi:hypothetical protein